MRRPYLWNGVLQAGERGPEGFEPSDPGLLHGWGAYETIRVERGRPLFLAGHLERLRAAAEFLGLVFRKDFELSRLGAGIDELLREAGLQGAVLRLVIKQESPFGESEEPRVSTLVTVSPLPESSGGPVRAPLRLGTWREARHPGFPLGAHKFLGRLFFALSLREAKRAGWDEGLLLDLRGHLAETSYGNLFWVRDGVLFTPTLDLGILPGVSRGVVLSLAEARGLEVREVRSHLVSLLSADEAFVTSSIREVQPVAEVDGFRIRGAVPGPVTQCLLDNYQSAKFDKP